MVAFLNDALLQLNQKMMRRQSCNQRALIRKKENNWRYIIENGFKYTSKAEHDKAINTLLHILEGISADQTVTAKEWELLANWVSENKSVANRHPYNQLIPPLLTAVEDRVLSEEERE